MKRQPLILAGTALGLLMASAPLSAFPFQGSADYGMAKSLPTLPLILAQADCQPDAGEDCTPKKRKQREKAAPAEQEQNIAPAGEASPAEPEQKPRRKKQREAQPTPEQQMAPEAQPEQNVAPAEEQKPRRKKQRQAEPEQQMAPEAQPEQNAAPAEEQKPRRKKKKEAAEPTPEQQTAPEAQPEQNAAPADQQEQKPRRKKQKEATEQAPAEQASPGAESEQPPVGKAESGSKQEKLRDYLKKKQGKEAPAEAQPTPSGEEAPKPEQKPAEQAAPTPEQKPAEATQPPAQNEQPAEQAGEPKSKKEKLRDYLKKKQEGGEPAPTETQQPAEAGQPAGQEAEPKNGQRAGQAGEAPSNGNQAAGEVGQGAQPELPADTRQQAMPKPRGKKGKRPENAAPLPDSAKNGQPAGESNEAGQTQAEQQQNGQPQTGQAEAKPEAVPQSDSAAQTDIGKIGKIEPVEAQRGKRLDRQQWLQDQRKWREGTQGQDAGQVVNEINNRFIVKYGDNIYVDNRGSNVRLERNARDSYVEALPDNFTRYTIVKDNGIRIVTIRNSYGDIVRRSRILPDNREVILYYVPESDYSHIRRGYYDAGADLPPLRLDIPADEYILDAQYAEPDDYYTYLDAPPVEPVERIYSVDEVVHSARIRDKVRRIDLDTITFDTGSAEIGEDQVSDLEALGDAINRILKQNPAETFLIEGHTDAVGSDESNLVLSDERAQSVAEALTSVFDIPAENLTTQGYGERYLKVNTQGANRENRRVAVRRITPLVAPVARAN